MNEFKNSNVDQSKENVVKLPSLSMGKLTTFTEPVKEPLEVSLAEATLTRLRSWFTLQGLRPSATMWEGIEDLCLCLQRMAEGKAKREFFLSSLDPGVGKTQTVFHFLLSLLASPKHEDVGAVVFMFTKEEIKTFVSEALAAGLPEKDFAARVHNDDEEVNALGCGNPERARILFTTHQRLVTICTGRNFGDVQEFRYRGQPRQVRIWDEGMLPSQPVLVNGRQTAGLYPHLPRRTELIDDLDRFRENLKRADDRSLIEVPDLAGPHGVPVSELQRHLRETHSDMQKIGTDLWHLFGNKAAVRKDGDPEPTMVSYRDNLPYDLAPVVILDASGRVTTTYTLWQQYRRALVRLKPGRKAYDNLTLHVWRIGGGASSFLNDGSLRRSGIVETIRSKRTERWLVVCHKRHEKRLKGEIEAELEGTGIAVEFTHWGLHRATNKYRDINNVILAGTMFLPPSVLEATGRAAAGCSPGEGLLTDEQERELLIGHQADIILQAICRGSARSTVDGRCGRCDAYIIVHPKHGIIERLRDEVFSDCSVVDWMPLRRPPSGNVARAIDYVFHWFSTFPDQELPFTKVYKALGMSATNFHKLRRHDDFIFAIAEQDIETDRSGRYARAFRRIEEPPSDGDYADYFPSQDDDTEAE
jgi:hypothetical protein